MVQQDDFLFADIERVNQIPIVKTMLEVICRSTGMGFAAVARVTEDRWIACSVQDEIGFGLTPGDELEIGTTICNEIRASGEAVVIDHVDESESGAARIPSRQHPAHGTHAHRHAGPGRSTGCFQ